MRLSLHGSTEKHSSSCSMQNERIATVFDISGVRTLHTVIDDLTHNYFASRYIAIECVLLLQQITIIGELWLNFYRIRQDIMIFRASSYG